MPSHLQIAIKPTDKSVKVYFAAVDQFGLLRDNHETALRSALWKQQRGYWEAKDERDNLEREIQQKIRAWLSPASQRCPTGCPWCRELLTEKLKNDLSVVP